MTTYSVKFDLEPSDDAYSVLDFLEDEYSPEAQLIILDALVQVLRTRALGIHENKSEDEIQDDIEEIVNQTGEILRDTIDTNKEVLEEEVNEETENDDETEPEESDDDFAQQEEFLDNFEDLFLSTIQQIEENNWNDAINLINGFKDTVTVESYRSVPATGLLVLELKN